MGEPARSIDGPTPRRAFFQDLVHQFADARRRQLFPVLLTKDSPRQIDLYRHEQQRNEFRNPIPPCEGDPGFASLSALLAGNVSGGLVDNQLEALQPSLFGRRNDHAPPQRAAQTTQWDS